MWQFIVKRLMATVLVIVATSMLTFGILHLTPGETGVVILKHAFIGIDETPEKSSVTDINKRYKLKDPLYKQYFSWSKKAIKGNFGTSYVYHMPVTEILRSKLPATALLAGISVMLSLIIAIPLGILCAVKRNSIVDHICRLGALLSVSMPSFWLGLLLIMLFSLRLDLFPVAGYQGFSSLILPCVTLSVSMAAVTMRIMRARMLEVLGEDYILTARAKGLNGRKVIKKHASRNTFSPLVTVVGLQFGHLLGGSVVVETVFAWPGIGKLLVDSILAKDIPVVLGCILFITAVYAVINLLVDLSYVLIDPRISYGR